MTQTEHCSNGSLAILVAFVGGAPVGGAAAILLARRSGEETRRRISEALGQGKDAATRVPHAIREASNAAQTAFAAAMKETP